MEEMGGVSWDGAPAIYSIHCKNTVHTVLFKEKKP